MLYDAFNLNIPSQICFKNVFSSPWFIIFLREEFHAYSVLTLNLLAMSFSFTTVSWFPLTTIPLAYVQVSSVGQFSSSDNFDICYSCFDKLDMFFKNNVYFNPPSCIIIIPIVWTEKLKHRRIKWLANSLRGNKC